MKTILTIGYSRFLLPSNANVNALIAVLQKATPVREEYSGKRKRHIYYPETKEHGRDIEIKLVPDDDIMTKKDMLAIPEKASEDAHNTFGS